MPTLLTLRHAARLLGVSPGRLYRAIDDGRLTASPVGGPGKPTLIRLEALQAFAQEEGLRVPEAGEVAEPPARLERLERTKPAERSMAPVDEAQAVEALAGLVLAQLMARQGNYVEAFLREELGHLVERVLERTMEPIAARLTAPLASAMVGRERADDAERLARAARDERSESADADLLALLQALLPRPRYLRDLGLETFPLARLNARLAPIGYVIEAKKVRDRARFVACADAHGQVEPFGLFAPRAVEVQPKGRRKKPAQRTPPDWTELYRIELGVDPDDTQQLLDAVRRDMMAAHHGDKAARRRMAAYNRAQRAFLRWAAAEDRAAVKAAKEEGEEIPVDPWAAEAPDEEDDEV